MTYAWIDGTIASVPAVASAGGLPTRLGKYEILMPLAAGGMARIYIGRSSGIGSFERHVVLKMILPERANDHTAVQMFLDEARLAAALNHQNVAQVFEVGEDGGIHYLAMEYVHGQDLRALLARAGSQGTRVPLELALTIVAGAASGLNHAHDRRGPDGQPLGIVHRDVSPSNIMIGYDGAVKLLDFGIAKATSRSIETQSGIIKGKFAYMAPEQCRGRDVDRRSDVFSLGIILYEVSTQHRCFRADSDFDTMHRIVTGDVRPTRLVQGYPAALEAIVMKALAVEPTQRYQSAGQLLEAIEAFAIASRMSLSTMALGRFMRDMFGEPQEPWLQARASQPSIAPARESTVSNTNNPNPNAADAASLAAAAQHTVLDMPPPISAEEEGAAWNAKSYPAVEQGFVAPPPNAPLPASPAESKRRSAPVIATPGATPATPVGASAQPSTAPLGSIAPPGPTTPPSIPVAVTTQPSGPLARPSAALVRTTPLPGMSPFTDPAAPPLSTTGSHGVAGPVSAQMPVPGQVPAGSQPMPPAMTAATTAAPNPAAGSRPPPFATPGSGSGPALSALASSAQPSAPTRHGYASASADAYPRYDANEDGQTIGEYTGQSLRPNRRGLVVAVFVLALGAAALVVALMWGNGSSNSGGKSSDPAVGNGAIPGSNADLPGSASVSGSGAMGTGSAALSAGSAHTDIKKPPQQPPPPPLVNAGTNGSNAATPPTPPTPPVQPDDDGMITVHVGSDPVTGAEVLLDGKRLGTTPLDIKIKRGSGMATLVVRSTKFGEATAKVDTTGDFSKQMTLKKDDKAPQTQHDTHPPKPPQPPQPPQPPPHKPNCQQPGPNMDPFTPVCK